MGSLGSNLSPPNVPTPTPSRTVRVPGVSLAGFWAVSRIRETPRHRAGAVVAPRLRGSRRRSDRPWARTGTAGSNDQAARHGRRRLQPGRYPPKRRDFARSELCGTSHFCKMGSTRHVAIHLLVRENPCVPAVGFGNHMDTVPSRLVHALDPFGTCPRPCRRKRAGGKDRDWLGMQERVARF